jgi:hypothetical protein
MSWPEFVVDPVYTPHVLAGGRSIGRLKLLWAQINRVGDHWQPHRLSRVVFNWRGIVLGVGTHKGMKFVELTLAYRRAALVWFDKTTLYKAQPSFSVMDRLQAYYDSPSVHGLDSAEKFGLQESSSRAAPLGNGLANDLLRGPEDIQ